MVPDDVISTEIRRNSKECNSTDYIPFPSPSPAPVEQGALSSSSHINSDRSYEGSSNIMEMVGFAMAEGVQEGWWVAVRVFDLDSRNLFNSSDTCDPPVPIVPYDVMVITWAILYWSSFFGCWIVYPLLISYVDMAEFHVSEKLSGAIKENILVYRYC